VTDELEAVRARMYILDSGTVASHITPGRGLTGPEVVSPAVLGATADTYPSHVEHDLKVTGS